jgi:hypothetical protein
MPQSRLEKLREQQSQIAAKIKTLAARERQQTRKDDTRRKIIAGALALHHMEKNPSGPFTKTLMMLLDEYVTRPNERKLFGLDPLPESAQPANDTGPKRGGLKTEFRAER